MVLILNVRQKSMKREAVALALLRPYPLPLYFLLHRVQSLGPLGVELCHKRLIPLRLPPNRDDEQYGDGSGCDDGVDEFEEIGVHD